MPVVAPLAPRAPRLVLALAVLALGLVALPRPAGAAESGLVKNWLVSNASWRYLDNVTAAPPAGWERGAADYTKWKAAPAVFGANLSTATGYATSTQLNRNSPSHAVDFFYTTFSATATNVAEAKDLTLNLLADDGAVVYVNGTKVLSDNMNLAGTAAAAARTGAPVFNTFSVPVARLRAGTNTVAVAVYQKTAADTDAGFSLRLWSNPRAALFTTSTTTSTTTTVLPAARAADETAALQAVLDAAPLGSTVTVDRPWEVAGTLTVPKKLVLSFTGQGALVRRSPNAGTRVLPVLVVPVAGSGTRFDNLAVQGPSGCTTNFPTGSGTYVNYYDATVEAQHGVDVRGATDLVFNAPRVNGMDGDGINLAGGAQRVTVNDARLTCNGRNAVSVTGASTVAVNRGTFTGSGLWGFDVEPFGAWSVSSVTVAGATVGMSGGPWLNASGPDFNCKVTKVAFTGTDRSQVNINAPTVAACVAAQVTVA